MQSMLQDCHATCLQTSRDLSDSSVVALGTFDATKSSSLSCGQVEAFGILLNDAPSATPRANNSHHDILLVPSKLLVHVCACIGVSQGAAWEDREKDQCWPIWQDANFICSLCCASTSAAE